MPSGSGRIRDTFRKPLFVFALAGAVLAAVSGVAYIHVASLNSKSQTLTILGELFKAGLTLTLVTVGGAALKVAADNLLEEQRARRAEDQLHANRREAIIREFVDIYSNFYSVRKLYHSALSTSNSIYERETEDYSALIRELLKRSVDLEGRFGALKVLAINFFDLRSGSYGAKNSSDLHTALEKAKEAREAARLRLDLLGEAYDDWRHALEEKRKIRPGEELWDNYEQLLKFWLEDDSNSLPKRKTSSSG